MLKIDPEFQSLIPPLSPDEYRQLETNIIQDGCRDPLVYWSGTLIDGHNRYRICQEHKVPYGMKEMVFDSREAVIEWIILNQFGRRNLSNTERAKLAMKLEGMIQEQAKRNQGKRTDLYQNSDRSSQTIHTNTKLAEIAGVSSDTIARYRKVQKEGDDEVKEKLDKGEITINAAYQSVKKPVKQPVAQLRSEPTTASKVGFKVCTLCRKEKPEDEFPMSGGIECKACMSSRTRLGLTVAQARELGAVDEELDRFYEEMKNPSPPDRGNELNKRSIDPIVTELETLLKPFRSDITKFSFMPQSRGTKETKNLIQNIINNLSKIYAKIEE